MFSLLYYLSILPRVWWFVNRILQENFNFFCKILLLFLPVREILALIKFGEGALIRVVQKTVKDRTCQTADHEHHPDQTVIVGCGDQQKTDQILGAG